MSKTGKVYLFDADWERAKEMLEYSRKVGDLQGIYLAFCLMQAAANRKYHEKQKRKQGA